MLTFQNPTSTLHTTTKKKTHPFWAVWLKTKTGPHVMMHVYHLKSLTSAGYLQYICDDLGKTITCDVDVWLALNQGISASQKKIIIKRGTPCGASISDVKRQTNGPVLISLDHVGGSQISQEIKMRCVMYPCVLSMYRVVENKMCRTDEFIVILLFPLF